MNTTPIAQVTEWLTAIDEKYDPALRERLLWEELREFQEASDAYHIEPEALWLPHIARELCDVAIVAIGTAALRGIDPIGKMTPNRGRRKRSRFEIEGRLHFLGMWPEMLDTVGDAAQFYGFADKLEACFAEVHRANMAKLECMRCDGTATDPSPVFDGCTLCGGTGIDVVRSSNGKIEKPTDWQGPNLGPILFPKEAS